MRDCNRVQSSAMACSRVWMRAAPVCCTAAWKSARLSDCQHTATHTKRLSQTQDQDPIPTQTTKLLQEDPECGPAAAVRATAR